MSDNWVVSLILPAISQNIGVTVERAGLLIAGPVVAPQLVPSTKTP